MPVENAAHHRWRKQCQSQQFIDGALIEPFLTGDIQTAFHETFVNEPLPVKRPRQRREDRRVVLRELLVNALVHRPYTQRGDIFLNLHPDRLEIVNPGPLPLGVTPQNVLHTTVRRNEHLARLFHDLKLMEREGSGFDKIFEVLLSQGRPAPELIETHDRVQVTVRRRILKPEVIDFIAKADQTYQLPPAPH